MNPLNMDHPHGHPEETFFEDASVFPGSRGGQTQDWLRRKDQPWLPFGDVSPAGISPIDLHPPTPDYITNCPNPNAFVEYRSVGLRSECETIPGDSGYGSVQFDNNSTYDEPFNMAPAQNLDHDLPEFKLSLQSTDHLYGTGEHHGAYMIPSSASEQRFQCPGCEQFVKTKSELKKHELRHTKPFRCQVTDCVRSHNGFASLNDLTRHQMTVHGKHGLGKTYYCNLEGCARKTKPWPRADNFRSHLQRVHKLMVNADADLSQYQNQSRDPYPITEDLSGIGSRLQETPGTTAAQDDLIPHTSHQDPIRDFPDIQTQPAPHHLRIAHQVSIEGLLPQQSQTEYLPSRHLQPDISSYQLNNTFAPIRAPSNVSDRLHVPHSLPKQEAVSPSNDTRSFIQGMTEVDAESDNASVSDEDSDIKDIQDSPPTKTHPTEGPALLEYLRNLPPDLLKEALSNSTGLAAKPDASSSSASRKSQCHQCKKTFNRPCELRKHMKRHERPYGCTVPRCTKKFGSKNDWKRHERGQHSHTEMWTCDQECAYFSYQREGLEAHLRSHHHITDHNLIDEKLENNRRGGHCVTEFWCGFCKDAILIDSNKPDQIDQRFDHIDNHFMGRDGLPRRDISAWCDPETFFKRKLAQPQYAEHGRKRKPNQHHPNPRPKKKLNTMTT